MTLIPPAPRYPAALWSPVSHADKAGRMSSQIMGWVLHVQAGNGNPAPWWETLQSPNRVFSHLWVSKTGLVRQYQRLDRVSWAQAGGNATWWSVETEGWPAEPLTGAQLDALARWHAWCGAPDHVSDSTAVRGIMTHSGGGPGWGNHPACPGHTRAAQRADIIRRAQALRGLPVPPSTHTAQEAIVSAEVGLTRAAIQALVDRITGGQPVEQGGAYYRVHDPDDGDILLPLNQAITQLLGRVTYLEQDIREILALLRGRS